MKNYVKEINSLYSKKIILSSRNGYLINSLISPALLMEDSDEKIPQTWDERAYFIIKQLILGHTYQRKRERQTKADWLYTE